MPSLFSWRPKIQIRTRKPLDSSPVDPRPVATGSNHSSYEEAEQQQNANVSNNGFGSVEQRQPLTESPTRTVRFAEGVSSSKPPLGGHVRPPSAPISVGAPSSAVSSPAMARHPLPFSSSVPLENHSPRSSRPYAHNFNTYNNTHDVKVAVAPLARDELEDYHEKEHFQPPRPARVHNFVNRSNVSGARKENRANLILQQLRDDDGAQSESSEMSANEQTLSISPPRPPPSGLNAMGVIFLQYNDEVKRSLLPPNLRSLEQLKRLFLRSFPNLTLQYINSPHVKLYIQEPSKGQLFYELDDLKDIKDRSVIKLKEQTSAGYQSPAPLIRFTDRPVMTPPNDYLSEPEIEDSRERMRLAYRFRPASAVPGDNGRTYNPQSAMPPKPLRSATIGSVGGTSSHYEPYYDPYYSDSSQGPRSGSVTPVIDKETRVRMETMERQLAGLSSLVHSALLSKGMSEAAQRDMLDLRRQILEFNPEMDRCSNSLNANNTNTSSIVSSASVSSEMQNDVIQCRRVMQSLRNDLTQLKRDTKANAQISRDILKDAFDKMTSLLSSAGKATQNIECKVSNNNAMEKVRTEHHTQLSSLQTDLQNFEANIENIRKSVLNSNRKLRMGEVEELTNNLTIIGRNAARLKMEYPQVQSEMEQSLRRDIARIMKEENEIKDGSQNIDNCLRRCKALANMMVTMKKLAMVQDPAIKPPNANNNNGRSNSKNSHQSALKTATTIISPLVNDDDVDSVIEDPKTEIHKPPPVPVPSSSPPKEATKKEAVNGHVLDSILDELNTPTTPTSSHKSKAAAEMTASLTLRVPPKPPERNSSVEQKRKYATTGREKNGLAPPPITHTNALDHFDNLSRLTVISSSESPNSQEGLRERAAALAGNKDRIEDKQRELSNQLERLQRLCPT